MGQSAGRVKRSVLRQAVNSALGARFGTGEWVAAIDDPGIYLNHDLVAARGLDLADVQSVAGEAAASVPGIAAFQTWRQSAAGAGAAAQLLSFSRTRSADVALTVKPFHIIGKQADAEEGSSHGSPYEYDTRVPLVFWGGGIPAGVHREPVDMRDLAPTLAELIGVGAPASSEGVARLEMAE